MTAYHNNFAPFRKRMEDEGQPDLAIETFAYYYTKLVEQQTGLIPEADIQPVASLPNVTSFPAELIERGKRALSKTVLVKLNGGLGTSMGLDKAKSLLTVKNDLCFLDITARQALESGISLVFMHSFATRDDSLAVLKQYPDLGRDIPLDFLQHKVLKVTQADFSPAACPQDPNLEWCPPGHGDLYTALITSGMLDTLLRAGYEYAFVSNADNLGAVMDTALLGYFTENRLPFMMEVADRTPVDKKGGHLAQLPNGQLILRELAQCSSDDVDAFQDIARHKYFNMSNLWLNLPVLQAFMTTNGNILGLPMIRNSKTVDPRDSTSTPIYQLETAMGSAIAIFKEAEAVCVPRTRFAPVKTTDDLLAVRSNAYVLTDNFQVVPHPARNLGQVIVTMDAAYYGLIDDMEARFPHGAPSLLECEHLQIQGDIKFGRNVILKGVVQLVNESKQQVEIEDGTVIEGVWQR